MTGTLRDELTRLLPPACLRGELGRWAVGGEVPAAVVAPENVEQVAALLAKASQERWKVVPAGAGTWLAAGNPPERVDIVLGLSGLRTVLEYEPADLMIRAQAGVALRALDSVCGEHRQWLPLDPPGDPAGTLGATLATGSAGPLASFYGSPRDHVLGLTLVTGDGRVLELGGRVVKNVAGYDLVKLAVGSWGTLGVIVSATLRLTPVPDQDATLLFRDADPLALVAAARGVLEKPMDPVACVVVSPATCWALGGTLPHASDAATRQGFGALGSSPRPPGGAADRDLGVDPDAWLLAVRLHGNREAVEDAVRRVEEAAGRAAARRLEGADGRGFWDAVSQAEAGVALVARVALPPSRLKDTLMLARRLLGEVGGGNGADGIIADACAGVVHALVRGGAFSEAGAHRRAAAALRETRGEVEGEGGTVVVSHGPPALVREVGAWGDPGPALRLMQELKRRFDPAGVLNPGRFVGFGSDRAV